MRLGDPRTTSVLGAAGGAGTMLVVFLVALSLGIVVIPTRTPTPRPSALPSASAGPDFRLLPALGGPVPTSPPTTGTLTTALVGGGAAPLGTAAVQVGWTGAAGSGASLATTVDGGRAATSAVPRGATSAVVTAAPGHDYIVRVALGGSAPAAVGSFRISTIDDGDAAVTYAGTWSSASYPKYLGQHASYSSSTGATATVAFVGQAIAWVGPVGPKRGIAAVALDGGAPATVELSAATYQPRRVLRVDAAPATGSHTLTISVASRGTGVVAIDSFWVLGPALHPPPTGGELASATLPIRAAFYDAWYPEAWQSGGASGYTVDHPSAGAYDSSDPSVIARHIAAMRYGGIGAAFVSWWGAGTRTDGRMPALLAAARGNSLSWAVDVGTETLKPLDAAAAGATLGYLHDHYAADPSYLRVGGRFVVVVEAPAGADCSFADRWVRANTVGAYLLLAVVPGADACPNQPDGWFDPDPSKSNAAVGTSSYLIRPGLDLPGAPSPALPRDSGLWSQSIVAMIASGAQWQLVDSFNDWGDGSSVESAAEWTSPSGDGTYLDALHVNGAGAAGPSPSPSASAAPSPTTAATAPAGDPVIIGAGAIASCSSTADEDTAQLLAANPAATVFTLGDNAYPSGTLAEFTDCYGPSWGAFKARTRPAIGTREYLTTNAAGYFDYFGAAAGATGRGWYAYDLGSWRIYVLNSVCTRVGGCGTGSVEERWLRADLASHPRQCIGAYWQSPRFDSGRFPSDPAMTAFWTDLYDAGAEFVIGAHDHNYQRYAAMSPSGAAAPGRGIREFIVGTGGSGHTSLLPDPIPNREVANATAYGVLKITLHPDGYEWQFLSTPKVSFSDAGSESCH